MADADRPHSKKQNIHEFLQGLSMIGRELSSPGEIPNQLLYPYKQQQDAHGEGINDCRLVSLVGRCNKVVCAKCLHAIMRHTSDRPLKDL